MVVKDSWDDILRQKYEKERTGDRSVLEKVSEQILVNLYR